MSTGMGGCRDAGCDNGVCVYIRDSGLWVFVGSLGCDLGTMYGRVCATTMSTAVARAAGGRAGRCSCICQHCDTALRLAAVSAASWRRLGSASGSWWWCYGCGYGSCGYGRWWVLCCMGNNVIGNGMCCRYGQRVSGRRRFAVAAVMQRLACVTICRVGACSYVMFMGYVGGWYGLSRVGRVDGGVGGVVDNVMGVRRSAGQRCGCRGKMGQTAMLSMQANDDKARRQSDGGVWASARQGVDRVGSCRW